MGILDFLRSPGPESAPTSGGGRTDTARKVVAELDSVEPQRARYLASYGYLLGRVAYADLDISDDEVAAMEKLLCERGSLPADQASLVVRLVKVRNELFGRTEDYLVAREFREITERAERVRLLDCLFAVAAADGVISAEEEAVIRQISSELGLAHRELAQARAGWTAYRSVFKEDR